MTLRGYIAALWLGCWLVPGALASEEGAFQAASKAFQDGFYQRAGNAFAEFFNTYPKSDKAPTALLYQAQCLFKSGQYDALIELLEARSKGETPPADRYAYWVGHAQYKKGGYAMAATTFGDLVARFPESPIALEARYWQAKALARLGDYSKVVEVLQAPQGFRELADGRPDEELVAKALLLLGEALLATRHYQEWLPVRDELSRRNLDPELNWQWEQLNSRNYLADGQLELARQSAANLVRLAEAAKDPRLLAESILLQGEALESLDQTEPALTAYRRILAPDASFPEEYRRRATEKVISLEVLQGKSQAAIDKLSAIVQTNASEKLTLLARLAMGELYLEQFSRATNPPVTLTGTNTLALARQQFDRLLSDSTNGFLHGEAHLRRGEAYSAAGLANESAAEFQASLGFPLEAGAEARARFKLGDALFRQQAFAGALTNYQRVVLLSDDDPDANPATATRALYQSARAAVEGGDFPAARRALDELLTRDPTNSFTYRAMVVVGQALMRQGQAAATRDETLNLLAQPASKEAAELKPDLELLVAQTFSAEGQWTNAAKSYQDWLAKYDQHPRKVEAVFDLGWLEYKSGNEERAFGIYTNFVNEYKSNPLAARAHNWLGNYYYRKGPDFADRAEAQFQRVYLSTNWPPSELTYRAQLMAGRMAVERQGWQEARSYFTNLINHEEAPAEMRVDALFALGDLTRLEQVSATSSPTERFEKAINIYSSIVQKYPNSPKVPKALGEIANCNWSLATAPPKNRDRFRQAAETYLKVLQSPGADAATRSQAKIGLGNVRAEVARLQTPRDDAGLAEAIDHYLDLVYSDDFYRPGENPDPFWVQNAGLQAGRLLEELGQKDRAIKLYGRLRELIPGIPSFWDERIKQLEK